ncbi:MAG: endonuclease/exonuclease/phosphatase family protein [Cyclonatronaceae bacterium]
MFKKLIPASVFIILLLASVSHAQPWKLVVHNVENLFDLDGYAVFQDYRSQDSDGNPQYTSAHVLTKLQNTARLMARYNEGMGPDIIMMVEMESDFSPLSGGERWNHKDILKKYGHLTISQMLGEYLDEEIRDLPSEILLLKAFEDHGLTGYDLAVAYDRDENLRPRHVQKNVIYSRLPIDHDRTRSHPVEDARPILEVWVDVNGHDLVLFNNHWKSQASNAEIEKTRVQNATVLKNRLDELRALDPAIDFVLGGDFNSDYNQSHRYDYMDETAVNDVLRSVGDERKVKQGDTDAVYNLWYEYDINMRGSDTYRGYWGTLMQIMVSPGLYDFRGVQYIDNSFEVGRFPGKNVYNNSMTPFRWHAFGSGGGYSDHLPISMNFTVSDAGDPDRKLTLTDPGYNDDEHWQPIPVQYSLPDLDEVIMPDQYGTLSIRSSEYFNSLMFVNSDISGQFEVTVNGEKYGLYSPTFNVSDRFADVAGTGDRISFIGRLGMFRGQWQFVIEDISYVNPEW